MTAIVGASVQLVAVQVSDRLVTSIKGSDESVHNPHANKTIVFHAADGLVVMSFAGLAYINETTTDTRLVELLTGTAFSGPVGVENYDPPWPSLAMAEDRLRSGLSRDFSNLSPREQELPLEVSIVGFKRQEDSDPIPIDWHVGKDDDGAFHVQDLSPQRTQPDWSPCLGTAGQFAPNDLDPFLNGLRFSGDPDGFEAILINAVQTLAGRRTDVGKDLMVVRLDLSRNSDGGAPVTISYIPHSDPSDEMIVSPPEGASGEEFFAAAYSPWLVTDCRVQSPQAVDPSLPPHTRGDLGPLPYACRHRYPYAGPGDSITLLSPYDPPGKPLAWAGSSTRVSSLGRRGAEQAPLVGSEGSE